VKASKAVLALARPTVLSLKPYTSARSLATEGLLLDANESPWPLRSGPVYAGLNRYPSPQPSSLKSSASVIYGVKPESVLVTRGSDEGIELLVRAFCEAGKDRLLFCPPTYGVYETAAAIQGCGVVRLPTAPPNFRIDAREIESEVRGAGRRPIKLVFVCTPNNPTGTAYPREELLSLAKSLLGRALLVVDEAYQEFSDLPSLTPDLRGAPNLVVLRTLSKAWGLAGLRCGFTLGDPALIALLQRIRAPYPLSEATIRLAQSVFNSRGLALMKRSVKRILAERETLAARLAAVPGVLSLFETHANFLLVKVADKDRLLKTAQRRGVILRDRSGEPGLAGCVRVSVGSPAENKAAVGCFQEALG
jgi:histidinol-phosphate aminotransferase